MIESKFYKKRTNTTPNNLLTILKKYTIKVLLTIIITLILLISFKIDRNFKEIFNKYVYNDTLPFTDFKSLYNKYFLGLKKDNTSSVFYEKLNYKSKSKYQDGVKLNVTNNYLVPSLNSGIVVFIGQKGKYGQTVIVQQVNGIDVFYGNIKSNVKMYDYIEKGSLIGESLKDYIYLAFQQQGKFVSYEEYIK